MDLSRAVAAIARVKSALDKEDGGAFSWLSISGGTIAATSRFASAAAPFPWGGDVVVAGAEFEAVLGRMPSDPEMRIERGVLRIVAGSFEAKVRLATESPPVLPAAPDDEDAHTLDSATLARFAVLSNFISDDPVPAWMNSLIIQRGRASAVGPSAVVYAYAAIPDFGTDALIPKRALAAVLAAKEPPDRIALSANRAAFFWPDGSWLASQLVDGKVPGTIDRLAEKAATSANPPEISPEWREAFVRVAGFAEDEVAFYTDRIVGARGKIIGNGGEERIAIVEELVESVVPEGREYSKWHKAIADLVVANAEGWDLSAYPAPAAFVGPVVRGLVTGRN